MRVAVTERLVDRADALAQSHALRGYDSIQLAAALSWGEALSADVVLATWNRELWSAAERPMLDVFPEDLDSS